MGDIGMIKGGACLEAPLQRGRRVIVDGVDHNGIDNSLGVYWGEEGEETVNTSKHKA